MKALSERLAENAAAFPNAAGHGLFLFDGQEKALIALLREAAELARRYENAPVAQMGNADAFSCFLERPQGHERGPIHALKGHRVRVVAEGE